MLIFVLIPWSVHLFCPPSPAAVAPCWCFLVWMLHAVVWCHSAEKVKQHWVIQLHRGEKLPTAAPRMKEMMWMHRMCLLVSSHLVSQIYVLTVGSPSYALEDNMVFLSTEGKMTKYPPLEENNQFSCTIFSCTC